jgi:hypothetical protein
MRSSRALFSAAVLIAAVTAGPGQAGPIRWGYEWNAHPIVVNADPLGPGSPAPGGVTLTPAGIAITGGSQGEVLGSASIVAADLTSFHFAPDPSGGPDRFQNAPYALSVSLRDFDSGQSRSLSFQGVFDGSMTNSSIDLQTHFTSATKQSVVIGDNLYNVTITSYTPPGPPSPGDSGEIKAFVDVQPLGVPEPSSLLLSAIGFFCVLLSLFYRLLG